jgi:hypothetical protein
LLIAVAILGGRDLTLRPRSRTYAWALIVALLLALACTLFRDAQSTVQGAIELSRNFYGVLKIYETDAGNPKLDRIVFRHGGTLHGMQFVSPEMRRMTTTYYTPKSGVGYVMKYLPWLGGRRVGVVGLGAGTLATYGRPGDVFRFYEINPEVRRLAETRFSFLKDSAARVEIVMGDARLSLEHEPDQQFDILVLDAFNSDSIPVHLLTREAFEVYGRHLQPGAVIAVHISNRSIDLEPIVILLARHFGYHAVRVDDTPIDMDDTDTATITATDSNWMLLSHNGEFLNSRLISDASSPLEDFSPNIRLWTDEDSSLLGILHY